MKLTTALKVIVAIGIAEFAGIIGSFFTMDAIPTWYADIAKPSWNPPSWLFGPVWTTLYAMMGIASYLVWRKMDSRLRENDKFSGNDKISKQKIRGALTIFGIQLVLNSLWSIIFFGLKNPGLAFAEIIVLWIAIVATIWMFAKISRPAAWLLVPYILWVSFAGFLNYTLWNLNRDFIVLKSCTMEVKTCSDGSTVTTSGPNCEFAACPELTIDPSWKTFTDEKRGISFRYPEALTATYIRAYDWPPQVAVTDGPFECLEAGSEMDRAGKTTLRKVANRSYCVTMQSGVAAGSVYEEYAYAVAKGTSTLIFTESLQLPRCINYDDPQRTECENEREAFDFNGVMDRIIQTTTIR